MKTAHIDANAGDFAKTVLMPGDPMRSKFIAENFLQDARLVNNVRGVQGYTGKYKGVDVSVMASGMGAPSIAIYSYELFKFFGVENIIRVGTAGGMSKDVHVRDVVIAQGASTDSAIGKSFGIPGSFAPIADYDLLQTAVDTAKEKNVKYTVGNVLTSDAFYSDVDTTEAWVKMGVKAVEMEAAALYMNAARLDKKALCICTISNHLIAGEELSATQRETEFTNMIEIALETAVKMEKN